MSCPAAAPRHKRQVLWAWLPDTKRASLLRSLLLSFCSLLDLPVLPEGRNLVPVMAQHQIREEPSPSSLMRRPKPLAGLGMKILIKEVKIAPMRIGKKGRLSL